MGADFGRVRVGIGRPGQPGQGAKGPQITEITAVDASTAEPSRGRPAGAGRPPMDRPSRDRSFDRPTGPAEEVDGQVKWYDPKKGFGFVAVAGGAIVVSPIAAASNACG